MRRKLCEIAYKLKLYKLSYNLSPSVYMMLNCQKYTDSFMEGFMKGYNETMNKDKADE